MDKRGKSLPNPIEEESINRGDSFRKVLPTTPSTSIDSRLTMSGRMIERPSAGAERGTKFFAPYIQEYCLWAEFLMFQKKAIPGLYVNTSDKDPLLWYGVLFIHDGLFEGGVFRFKVHFPASFPDSDCPRLVFDCQMFHPAVSKDTGDLNVTAEFRTWRRGQNHVWQILQYAKDVFDKVPTSAPLNLRAAELLENDPNAFQSRARECAVQSRSQIFTGEPNDDINYIRFEPYNKHVHGMILSQLKLESCFKES